MMVFQMVGRYTLIKLTIEKKELYMSNQCKFYKQKKQYSLDGGVTWYDVVPAEYQKGELYEYESTDCNCLSRTIQSGYTCYHLSKYELNANQISCTTDSSWVTTSYTRGDLVEESSAECGGDANANYPFTVRNLYNNISTINLTRYSSVSTSFKYSTDGGNTYTSLNGSGTKSVQLTLSPNQTVKIISDVLDWPNGTIGLGISHSYGIEGNILSLSMYDNYNDSNTHTIGGNVNSMFRTQQNINYLIDASKLSFGKNLVLEENNFNGMFSGCEYLQYAPKILPSTEVPNGAYKSMFNGCGNLTSGVSYIMGESFSGDCLQSMFYECSAMTNAPVIFAEEIVDVDCSTMFYQCKNMTSPTEPYKLKYTKSYTSACLSMFYGCSGLTTTPVSTLEINVTCTGTGETATCNYMADSMFRDCSNLQKLPTIILKGDFNSKYNFTDFARDCGNINEMTVLTPDYTGNATYIGENMLYGASYIGTFYKSSNTTWDKTNAGIPTNWTIANA